MPHVRSAENTISKLFICTLVENGLKSGRDALNVLKMNYKSNLSYSGELPLPKLFAYLRVLREKLPESFPCLSSYSKESSSACGNQSYRLIPPSRRCQKLSMKYVNMIYLRRF